MWNIYLGIVGAALLASLAPVNSSIESPAPAVHRANSIPGHGARSGVASCTETVNQPRRLRIRMVPGMDPTVIAGAQAEVTDIWRRYGVVIDWIATPVDAAVQDAPDLYVFFVDQRVPAKTAGANEVIAWIPFVDGAPMHFVRVSRPAAQALLETRSWWDERPIKHALSSVQQQVLGRVIGRAIAHEIGHFLLASQRHTEQGLMRAAIDDYDLVRPGLRNLKLHDDYVRSLRAARLAACELVARNQ